MSDRDEVGRVLRSLPRAKVAPDYTERVLERVRCERQRSTERPQTFGRRAFLAAALVLVSLGALWLSGGEDASVTQLADVPAALSADELAALRAEMDALRVELETLQRRPQRSVFAVPGDDGRDVLMDFRPARFTRPSGRPDSMIQPARFERVVGVSP